MLSVTRSITHVTHPVLSLRRLAIRIMWWCYRRTNSENLSTMRDGGEF
jgi:hypothetical protein